MNHSPDPDDSGGLKYEDFEDVTWKDSSDLEPIDLESLDDEIEPVAEDEATEELLEVIDTLDEEISPADAEPPALEPAESSEAQVQPEAGVEAPEPERKEEAGKAAEPAAAVEAVAEPEAPIPAPESPAPADKTSAAAVTLPAPVKETVSAATGVPPAPAPLTYQVLIGLPPDLGARVLELRTTGEITDTPPPGIALTACFTAADLPAVENALAAWVRVHLPLQLETTGVVAEVTGEQQYVAAWSLEPEEELAEAQRELAGLLAPLITLPPDTPTTFSARVAISDHVPARRYPHVIAQMQRDFETYVWHATELLLVQHSPDAAPGDWKVAKTFD